MRDNARQMSRRLYGRLDLLVGAILYLFCAIKHYRLCLFRGTGFCNLPRVGADKLFVFVFNTGSNLSSFALEVCYGY